VAVLDDRVTTTLREKREKQDRRSLPGNRLRAERQHNDWGR
jgi:hypothetical protein